jgi:hypothetical protein
MTLMSRLIRGDYATFMKGAAQHLSGFKNHLVHPFVVQITRGSTGIQVSHKQVHPASPFSAL